MNSKQHSRAASATSRGLSLIEVLVAFVILAMVMSVIMRINATSLRNHNVSAQYLKAVQIAQSRMVEMGVDRSTSYLNESGSESDGIRWEYVRQPYTEWEEARLQSLPMLPVEEKITLFWSEETQASPRKISFSKVSLIEASR
jgi:general secretion pathway protein I